MLLVEYPIPFMCYSNQMNYISNFAHSTELNFVGSYHLHEIPKHLEVIKVILSTNVTLEHAKIGSNFVRSFIYFIFISR